MKMRHRLILLLVAMALSITFIGFGMAAGKGNARKGKYLFRKNCRTCHMNGGTAIELSPISKTQAEWEKVFAQCNQLQCKDVWAKLSEKDVQDMYAYLYGHAYDSPSPAKCQ